MKLGVALLICCALRAEISVSVNGVAMPLEKYVAAVVAGESGVLRSDEAVKAMAVTARTYAVRMRGRHGSFDFCATTHCQRLDERAVNARIVGLVGSTAGELLWFHSRPAFAVYGKDCGGRTESVAVVWPDVDAPYLASHDDPYCSRERWKWAASGADVLRALKASKLTAPSVVREVRVIERTPSGRARLLDVGGVRVSASSFRFAMGRELGWNLLRSEKYAVDGLHFAGTGSGHGVGLCQRGADAMGLAGHSYREILSFYYPGTSVSASARDLAWVPLGGERVSIWTTRPEHDRGLVADADRAARHWVERTGLSFPAGVEVRVYPDVESFRNATGAPGSMAGYTSGRRIHLQSQSALPHELLHALLESHARGDLPKWFREGLAGYIEGSEHRRVTALVRQYGEATVLGWLEHGLPASVLR